MDNSKLIIKRIKELFGAKNNKVLSTELDVPYETLNGWIKRNTIPFEVIDNIVESKKVSYDWLLMGRENPIEEEKKESYNFLKSFYSITKLSIHASAGVGIENFHIEEIGQVLLDKELFRYNVNPKSLKVIQVKGDSMQPTIMDDAHVVIDESQREQVDAIYAICLGGQVMVKRLQFNHLNGTVAIRSDNPNYEEQIYNPKESQVPLKILGKKVLVIQ